MRALEELVVFLLLVHYGESKNDWVRHLLNQDMQTEDNIQETKGEIIKRQICEAFHILKKKE